MHHLRHRRDVRCLALLALALQVVLSFGHVHAARAALGAAPLACRTFFPPAAREPCPPTPHEHASCAVCCSLAASGLLVLPEPPAVALPDVAGDPPRPAVAPMAAPASPATAFDARGPPSSAT